jgi:lipopolysaccharide export system protein LptA
VKWKSSSAAPGFLLLTLVAGASLSGADVFTASALHASGRETEDGELVIDLSTDVHVTDGEVVVTSDSGTVWQQSERAVFIGNVHVTTDTLTATGERLYYDRIAGIVRLTGNAVLTDGENVIEAREVTWFRESEKATAEDDVIMTGPWLGRVTGQYAMYDRERGSLFVTVDPVLQRVEDGDSMTVLADRLEFFPDENRAEAQGNASVDVPAREFTATSEYLKYFGDDDRFELLGSPEVLSPDGDLSGDWMEIIMADGNLSTVRVEGGADGYISDESVTPPSETWFQSQKALFTWTSSGDIESIELTGSVFVSMKGGGEAAERAETNTVLGEHLIAEFSGGEMDRIIITGSVRGTYSYSGEFR